MTRRRQPAIVFATRSRGTTIDRDAFGGNPFATALIQLAGAEPLSLRQFPRRLRALTVEASQRHQVPEWTGWPERLTWSFRLPPGSREERRCALLLIVSEYAGAGLAPLAGAARDERRMAAMLGENGFSVVQGVDRHGVESDGDVYLLPGDYPLRRGCSTSQLRARAVPVDRIAATCRASKVNLVFFAGCRTLASRFTA